MSEQFGNPYRWVQVHSNPQYTRPVYHHHVDGLSGKLKCRLTALTPLFIGGNRGTSGVFLLKTVDGRPTPFIPGTSLKGCFRSLVEILSGSAAPFRCKVDNEHRYDRAATGQGLAKQLDTASRMFGTLHGADQTVYAGSVQCSDATFVGAATFNQWPAYNVVVGAPDPKHIAFYPTDRGRKFYLHKYGATALQTTQLAQARTVRPAPPDSTFEFEVEYTSLSQAELSLLIYSIVLQEHVEVVINSMASGTTEDTQLTGPMRHKIGGCKAVHGGSSHIEILQWLQACDAMDRYQRGQRQRFVALELPVAINESIAPLVARVDNTMLDLRAAMIYCLDDPRATSLRYPSRTWFNENSQTAIPPLR